MRNYLPKRPKQNKFSISRSLMPVVLVIMLAGIIFPFIAADEVSSPVLSLPAQDEISDEAQQSVFTNKLSPQEYADIETTASKDSDSTDNRSDVAAAAGTFWFLVPFYSKLSPDRVLQNQSRAQLYNMVSSQPGITFGTLARVLSIAPGTAEYHLRILERENYLRSRKCGKFIRYYPYEMATSPYTPVQQKILNSLAIEPDQSQTDLAEQVGVSKQVVNYNLKQLRDFGVVNEHKQGTKIICRLNSETPYTPNAF
jgi:DNA-binding MarR family transcriptional regulator